MSALERVAVAGWQGRAPARERMLAKRLGLSGAMCRTMHTAGPRSDGRSPATRLSVSTPPAEAPITTRSRWPLTFWRSDCSLATRTAHAPGYDCAQAGKKPICHSN